MVDSVEEYHTVQGGNIPDALKALDQWVCWRYETRDGTRTKVPYMVTDRRASATDPATWASFAAVWKRYSGGYDMDGIGFVFRKGGGIAGIDLDKCFDGEGRMHVAAAEVVGRLLSYTEVSPSGTGAHGIVFATLPDGGRKRQMPWGGAIEMYDSGRFFTMTGDLLEDAPLEVERRPVAVAELHAELFPVKLLPAPARVAMPLTMGDDELLDRARNAADGIQFARYYDYGDLGDFNGDRSSADLALCNKLMFWCGNDASRADGLFRRSALMRDKWLRDDYRERTLSLARQAETYSGPAKRPTLVRAAAPIDDENDTTAVAVDPPFPDNDTENAELLLATLEGGVRHVAALGDFYLERGGIWEPDGTNGVASAALAVGRSLRDAALAGAATADAKALKGMLAHVKQTLSARGTSAMLQQLARLDGVRVSHDVWDRQKMLIACRDGVVDLAEGRLMPHDKELLISRRAEAGWMERVDEAAMPYFMGYLRSSFVDKDGATQQENIDFMQRWGGYCLTGETSEQKFLLMMGEAGSGKGTWCNLMEGILPQHYKMAAGSVFLEGAEKRHATELADLFGARIVVASEFNKGVPINTAILKRLTGQDVITARKMRMDQFSFLPTFKAILLLNESPTFDEGGNGLWRRMIKLDFWRLFSEYVFEDVPGARIWRKDGELLGRMLAGRDAIFRWLVEGAVWWNANRAMGGGRGLDVPEGMIDARDEFRQGQDVPGSFVAACCYAGAAGEGHSVDAVFEKWNTYRFNARERELPLRQFVSEMVLRGHAIEHARHGVQGQWFSELKVKV